MVTGPLHLSRVPMPMTVAQVAYGLPCTQPRLSSYKAADEKQLMEAEAWGCVKSWQGPVISPKPCFCL